MPWILQNHILKVVLHNKEVKKRLSGGVFTLIGNFSIEQNVFLIKSQVYLNGRKALLGFYGFFRNKKMSKKLEFILKK